MGLFQPRCGPVNVHGEESIYVRMGSPKDGDHLGGGRHLESEKIQTAVIANNHCRFLWPEAQNFSTLTSLLFHPAESLSLVHVRKHSPGQVTQM
jgi:hypothetical protein